MTRFVVAVVGAGPSGIYAAEALTSQTDVEVDVVVVDRLPVPFGLVRYGVAPDHPGIRSIRSTLERTLEKDGVSFFGNVAIGRDLDVQELRSSVDAVIYAYGAGASRRLGIPGEDAAGSLSAPDFVAWYCGHPDVHPDGHPAGPRAVGTDHAELAGLLGSTTSAVVVGAGNVALDVTRVLIKTADELTDTDMAREVLAVLADKRVTDVHLLARRGPAYTQMTTKELRELGAIDCDILVHPGDLDWDAEEAHAIGKVAARNLAEIRAWADGARRAGAARRIHLHFWTRPTEVHLTRDPALGVDRVAEVAYVDNRPGGTATGTVPAQLLVRAIGYHGVELPGVPFDPESGRVPHVEGRVLQPPADGASRYAPGEYVTGWIKRGPNGVIGTNKSDAVETVRSMLLDIAEGDLRPTHPRGLRGLTELLRDRGITPLDLPAWHRIDAAEIDRGRVDGRDRTTLARRSELLEAAGRE